MMNFQCNAEINKKRNQMYITVMKPTGSAQLENGYETRQNCHVKLFQLTWIKKV